MGRHEDVRAEEGVHGGSLQRRHRQAIVDQRPEPGQLRQGHASTFVNDLVMPSKKALRVICLAPSRVGRTTSPL